MKAFSNDELISIMIYARFCIQTLNGKDPDENKYHKNILMPFLDKNIDIKDKYFLKKKNDSS